MQELMKVNDDQPENELISFATEIKQMKEEFKVLGSALKLEKETNATQHEKIEKLESQIGGIREDLEMSSHMYGRESTRKIARDAFNQSTVSANWEGLEKHPVVKNLFQSIMDSRKDLGCSIQNNAIRLDNARPANEVFEELDSHTVITELRQIIDANMRIIESHATQMDNDRYHANQQDSKMRDKMADFETAINLLDFVLGETTDKQDSANIFLMGAWARSGYPHVEKGLREILKKPKEKKK